MIIVNTAGPNLGGGGGGESGGRGEGRPWAARPAGGATTLDVIVVKDSWGGELTGDHRTQTYKR